ncbi:hypothetical protein NEOLEDRAFT_1039605, partial [Neolentinus lepideus HHB14362 ss-1]
AAGLIALADLKTPGYRIALKGTSSFLDALFLVPGIHCQRYVSNVNGAEYPATGAMTTGYVFRTENEATVYYLQRVGLPGHLVTLEVLPTAPKPALFSKDALVRALYLVGIVSTLAVTLCLYQIQDLWGLYVVAMLITARLLNILVIKRRSKLGWKGAPEPGVKGDLLILLSQDRWVRMRGLVDDLKTVTSGSWMREETTVESFFVNVGTILVYASPAVAVNASAAGGLLIGSLLLITLALLGLCNALTETQHMFGRTLRIVEPPKKYRRRLDLVEELVKVSGRNDWAIGMGMIVP